MSEPSNTTNTSAGGILPIAPTLLSGVATLVCIFLALKDFKHWQEADFEWSNVIAASVFGTLFFLLFWFTFRQIRNAEKPNRRPK